MSSQLLFIGIETSAMADDAAQYTPKFTYSSNWGDEAKTRHLAKDTAAYLERAGNGRVPYLSRVEQLILLHEDGFHRVTAGDFDQLSAVLPPALYGAEDQVYIFGFDLRWTLDILATALPVFESVHWPYRLWHNHQNCLDVGSLLQPGEVPIELAFKRLFNVPNYHPGEDIPADVYMAAAIVQKLGVRSELFTELLTREMDNLRHLSPAAEIGKLSPFTALMPEAASEPLSADLPKIRKRSRKR